VKRSAWRWVVLPAVVFAAGAAAGVKAGIEYAKGTYVSKDRPSNFTEAISREEMLEGK
jgi:hypothetical protein